jgi:hypothetical protein
MQFFCGHAHRRGDVGALGTEKTSK